MTTTTTIASPVNAADHGPGTRRRLLDAAAELFAARGYRGVAVRDICEQACTNIAAVNYHFGGKDKLHAAALDHARKCALETGPLPADTKPNGALTPKQKLRRHVRAMLGRAFASGPAGWYMQIVLREMADPTPALKQTLAQNIAPHQRKLESIVAQVIDADPDTDRVQDIAGALLANAVFYYGCRSAVEHLRPGFALTQDTAERLTDTLCAMVG